MVKTVLVNGAKFLAKIGVIGVAAIGAAEVGAAGMQAACNDFAVLNSKKLTDPKVVKVKKYPWSKKATVTVESKDLYRKGVTHRYSFKVDKKALNVSKAK